MVLNVLKAPPPRSPTHARPYSGETNHTAVPMPIFQMGILRLRALTEAVPLRMPPQGGFYLMSLQLPLRFLRTVMFAFYYR